MGFSDYLENKLVDWMRGQAFPVAPANEFVGLLTSTKGPRANSTLYALNDTISLTANDGKTHLYKCTTGGTSAAAQGTLYPGAANEAIVDGTATFTEQDSALDAGTAAVEPVGNGYARVSVPGALTAWAGTQGAGTTVASSGSSGQTSNNAAVTFPAPTAAGPWGFVWGVAIWDASTAGNQLYWGGLTTPKTVNASDAAPSFAAASLTIILA